MSVCLLCSYREQHSFLRFIKVSQDEEYYLINNFYFSELKTFIKSNFKYSRNMKRKGN